MALNGNKKMIRELKFVAIDWVEKLIMDNRSPKELCTVLYVHISVRLKYPIPTCTLSKKEYAYIMYPSIRATLPRTCIASNISTKIRDRLHSCVGVGVGIFLVLFSGNTSNCYDSRIFE